MSREGFQVKSDQAVVGVIQAEATVTGRSCFSAFKFTLTLGCNKVACTLSVDAHYKDHQTMCGLTVILNYDIWTVSMPNFVYRG